MTFILFYFTDVRKLQFW